MKLSSMHTIAGKLALGLVAAGLFSSCETGNLIPASTGTEPSADAVTAAAKTQREFQEYWAAQRQLKESGKPAVAKTAPEPKPEAVVAAQPPSEVAPRQTFSQWRADRKAQKAQIEPVAEEEPMVAAPQEAPAAEKKSWSIPQWFGGNKDEGPAEASQDPAPAPPVAAAAPEPKEKKSGGWWGRGKKQDAASDVSDIDLSGNFPTARSVDDWEGFVYSPYNKRFVDVKGVASGTLVADPRFDISERKFFIVP